MSARLDWRRFWPTVRRAPRPLSATRTDLNPHLRSTTAFFYKLQNTLHVVLLKPVDDKSIRRKQTQ